MELLTDPQAWVALLALTALQIVLGIDNIVFISIMAAKLPPAERERARVLGLAGALITRIILLFGIFVIVSLTEPIFEVFGRHFSGRDLILLGGGLFLIAKATFEIHERLEGEESSGKAAAGTLTSVVIQIVILDIIFSLDSTITAVGMSDVLAIQVASIILAVIVMLVASKPIGNVIERHPSLKILALSFLLLIGTSLIAEGFEISIPREYIYFAMGFSVLVEMLNIRAHTRGKPL
ncbi:MAG TPA: TerC family protein, partial [Candidatus Limnocylindrales bacterium]|nr:TerC family protein [Candidatus Limnocylindrales bacterium]